ncbi:MAG: ornithine cyclodeaminase family protein [Armatimonadetes bacterium]|nr:ornithine cyclodeaminase family protein [Armatimonadota bacterium]
MPDYYHRTMTLFLTESDVQQLLPMSAAMERVEAALRQQGFGRTTNQPRRRVQAPPISLNVMFAAQPEERVLGLKTYTVGPSGANFHVLLYSADDGHLLCVLQANCLGQIRTGAASGIATRYLARADAHVHTVFGTGWQARTQVEAVCHARQIEEVRCYSRNPENRSRFAAEMSAILGVRMVAARSPRQAVDGADIVTTITNAREPVFEGDWLTAGTHLNVAGSNSLLKREIDETTVRRAAVIVVDDRHAVPLECGDLLAPLEKGTVYPEALVELGEVVAGHHPGRTSPEQITLFKSHGMALEDVAVAAYVYRAARERGLGVELPV